LIKDILINIKKDFKIETRDRAPLLNTIMYAMVSVTIISLILGPGQYSIRTKAILYWLIIFFSAAGNLAHIFMRENERGTILLLKARYQPAVIFIAKFIINLMLTTIMISLITLLFFLLIELEIKNKLLFLISIYGGGFTITAALCLPAALIAESRSQGTTFTIISFPVMLPVLWVNIQNFILATKSNNFDLTALLFYLSYSSILITISVLLYKYTWQDD